MSWQTILLIVLTALLLFVWLPWLIISIRKLRRETSGPSAPTCHPEPTLCHPELVEGSRHPEPTLCHPEPTPCHPEPTPCHPEPVEGSPTDSNNKK